MPTNWGHIFRRIRLRRHVTTTTALNALGLLSLGGPGGNKGQNKKEKMYQLALRSFDLKPREVVEYLDRFIIQRYDTKKILAVAICDHYNHCRRCLDEERSIEESKRRRKNKNNNKEQDDEEDEDFDDD